MDVIQIIHFRKSESIKKRGDSVGSHTMATAPCGWARSVASCNPQGLPNTQAWPDSRRYREKIRTILEAARWRPRFLVGLAQWLRVTLKDCQILRPGRTVAATGKDPHDFAGSTLATAVYGRGKSLSSCQYLGHIPAMSVLGPTSPILIHPPAWWFTILCRTDSRRYLKKAIAVSRLSCSYRQRNSQPKIQDAIYLQSQPV
jgi:hypothetical protein